MYSRSTMWIPHLKKKLRKLTPYTLALGRSSSLVFGPRKSNNSSTSGVTLSMSVMLSGAKSLTSLSSSRRRFCQVRAVLMKYPHTY